MVPTMIRDLRYGVRMLLKNSAFTTVTVLILAIGIGANTALFSVVDCLLLRPLPYPGSERLVIVWSVPPRGGISNVSPANFLDFRDQNRVFEAMGAAMMAEFNVRVQGVAEKLAGFRVSAGFLEMLGAQPALGRSFTPADERAGAPRVAILSHGAWQRRFGGDPRIVGQPLVVDGESFTVAGILPANFRFVYAPEILTPAALDPAGAPRDFHVLAALAKLRPGITREQARAEMEGIARNLAASYPAALKGWSVDVWPWRDNIMGQQRRSVLVLFGAVGLVLLIGCVNLANLLLAQAAARQRELAVRAALGAGRLRLMRQVLTESVLLSAVGGVAGVLLASWLVGLAATLVSAPIAAGLAEVGIDWRVLLFALALSIFTGLLFGAAPAWRASQVNLNAELKSASHAAGGWLGQRMRGGLVVAEVALSLMLLVGAGLTIRSLVAAYSSDPGLRTDNVLTMRLTMPAARYKDPEQVRAFDRLLLQRLNALPGVRAAALASFLPLEAKAIPMRFQLAANPVPPAERPRVAFQYVSDRYFETLGIQLRRGRLFAERDNESAPRVVIVNEAFVNRFLEKEEPLGQRLLLDERWVGAKRASRPWEIAGVVANVKIGGLHTGNDSPLVYAPLMQWPQAGGVLAVHTATGPAGMASAVRDAVRDLDRDVPVSEIRTMEQVAAASVAQPRSRAWILGAFAAAALVLAGLGVYGVMSHTVIRRMHELGVRLALGAQPGELLRSILRQGMLLAGLGLLLGLAGSLALTRVIRSLLYAVDTTDPLTYAAVSGLLLAVALLAAYLPARRAARVDPLVTLRWE
jgi:putative ABC transport system permease protein